MPDITPPGEPTMTTPEQPEQAPPSPWQPGYTNEPPPTNEGYYQAAPPPQMQPMPPQYQHPQQYPPFPYVVVRPTNGMAIASMVLGILWLYWIGSILALIFGYVARNEIRKNGQGGDGMAIAGIVLGWVGVGILTAVLIIGAATAWRW
jgi:hypothetical protein